MKHLFPALLLLSALATPADLWPIEGDGVAYAAQEEARDAGSPDGENQPTESAGDAVAVPVADTATEPDLGTPPNAETIDPLGVGGKLIQDITTGNWRHAAAGVLLLVMFGVNWFRKSKATGFWASDRGGATLLLLLATAGGLVTALFSSSPLSAKLVAGGVTVAFEAGGVFLVFKKLLFPSDLQEE